MNSNRLFAIFSVIILAGAGYAVYQWVQPEDVSVVRSTAKKSGSPVSKLVMEKGTVRSAKTLQLSRKDDVGTEVRQQNAGERSADVIGDFQNLDAVECARHASILPVSFFISASRYVGHA